MFFQEKENAGKWKEMSRNEKKWKEMNRSENNEKNEKNNVFFFF